MESKGKPMGKKKIVRAVPDEKAKKAKKEPTLEELKKENEQLKQMVTHLRALVQKAKDINFKLQEDAYDMEMAKARRGAGQ